MRRGLLWRKHCVLTGMEAYRVGVADIRRFQVSDLHERVEGFLFGDLRATFASSTPEMGDVREQRAYPCSRP